MLSSLGLREVLDLVLEADVLVDALLDNPNEILLSVEGKVLLDKVDLGLELALEEIDFIVDRVELSIGILSLVLLHFPLIEVLLKGSLGPLSCA